MSNKKYWRICPKCGEEIPYSRLYERCWAEKRNTNCKSCSKKGKNHPMYGKTRPEETREKLSESKLGKNNPMYGKNVYQIWLGKYGKKEADRLMNAAKKKWSIASSGANNPMYGKPSPNGSGNGWSGWYKGWFFRSLRELSYVILVLEPQDAKWCACESTGIKIPYKSWDDKDRTYVPDFIVDDNYIIEIKPDKLRSSMTVRLKQAAAETYCQKRGWSYSIIDPQVLSKKQIKDLRDSGKIRFTERYEKMYQARYV